MKNFSLLLILLTVNNAFSQISPSPDSQRFPGRPGVITYPDTTLRVVYVKKMSNPKVPAYYLNGKLVNSTFFNSIDPKLIDGVNTDKDSLQIRNVTYYGKIHIKTKSSYQPQIISLSDLKDKYTNLKGESVLFIVDGELVTTEYDSYVVDEKLLWRIIIDKVENENATIKFIKLLTKSEENLRSKQIRIRGLGAAVNE